MLHGFTKSTVIDVRSIPLLNLENKPELFRPPDVI